MGSQRKAREESSHDFLDRVHRGNCLHHRRGYHHRSRALEPETGLLAANVPGFLFLDISAQRYESSEQLAGDQVATSYSATFGVTGGRSDRFRIARCRFIVAGFDFILADYGN